MALFKTSTMNLKVSNSPFQVENDLTFEKLIAWTKPDIMWSTEVKVFLPKFKLQEDYEMKSVLQDWKSTR